jgi:hypothetical protein
MDSISLYSLTTDEIKISIDARFDGEALVIDGYDIGKKVKDYWGDSDYEYITTIAPEGVKRMYTLLSLEDDNKAALLSVLASRFHTNTCYSEIQRFLADNKIPYEGFSWI